MPDLVVVDPDVLGGKPVIAGTRIAVEYVLEELGDGRTVQELLDRHPRLTREGVVAAVQFAIEALRSQPTVARTVRARMQS